MAPARVYPPTTDGLNQAAACLAAGGLLAFATETVYGLGADARDGRAVAAIFEAKGRPSFNPLIVHVSSLEDAAEIGQIDGSLVTLARRFWPGPLTLVVPKRIESGISDLVSAGLETIAIRVPAHPLAQKLLRSFGRPVAAPSANPSGKISPTMVDHVLEGLGDRIDAVLDGGPCAIGLESTIVGATPDGLSLLRPGGVPREDIEAALGSALRMPSDACGAVTAPGQLASHYAPNARLRLNASSPRAGELWLGFGSESPVRRSKALSLSPSGDLREAAANLFAHLRELDACADQETIIAVARIPDTGLGQAINDRLRRAAAPR